MAQTCTFKEAQEQAQWFTDNGISGGVTKAPYDDWQPDLSANPQPESVGEWLMDTVMGDTGISAALIIDRRAKYGDEQALQMCRDEFKGAPATA